MRDISSSLVVISGPSGAGKDTIVGELLKMDDSFSLSVSATSRAPRGSEVDGVNYFFISESDFLKRAENGEFIEYAKYGSNYYGTLKCDVARRIESGKTVILVIEVNGARNIKRLYPNALSIFITPPSEEVLEMRLRCRMTDSEEDINRRMGIARCELERKDEYDFVVINDDLKLAVNEIFAIICEHKKKEG